MILITEKINKFEDYRIAENISEGKGFILESDIGPTALKAPVYPFFLSIFINIFKSKSQIITILFQHIIFSFLPVLLYKIGEMLRGEKFGFLSALLFLFYPSYINYPNTIEVASISIPCSIILLYFILKGLYERNNIYICISALFSGILSLLQPMFFLILVVIYISLFFYSKRKIHLLATTFIILMVFPWICRNYFIFHKIILIKSPFWQNIYVGFLPQHHEKNEFDIIDDAKKAEIEALSKIYNDVEMEEEYKRVLIPLIQNNIKIYLKKSLYQLKYLWWAPPKYQNNKQFFYFRLIPLGFLYLCSFFGLFISLFNNQKYLFYVIIFINVSFSIIYAFTFAGNVRFKLEFEWLLLFPACELLLYLFSKSHFYLKCSCVTFNLS